MAAQSSGYHEDPERLQPAPLDRHRAIASAMEELEAIDWYDQRVDATRDDELRAILAHNRDEEKEHAAMVLEWLRRRDPVLDKQLRDYLFSSGSILRTEQARDGAPDPGSPDASPTHGGAPDGSLHIGSLRKEL